MTTGNKTMDATTPNPSSNNPFAHEGYKWTKVWSGDDRVPTPPVYQTVTNPVTGKTHRSRVRQKRNDVPHAYSMTATQYQYAKFWTWSGTVAKYVTATYCGFENCVPAWGPVPWTANDDITLIAKLHEKVYGSDFNPAVFLAEGNRTVQLIGDAARRLAMSYAYLRKGNIREAARVISGYQRHKTRGARADRSLARTVLEVQYGWRPLMRDMKDGAEFLAHLLHAPFEQRFVVRRTVVTDVDPNGNQAADVQFATCSHTARGQIVAYLSEKPHNAVLQSILHPEAVIWEKLPWSFVADWAIPIGSYLQARAIASTLTGTFVKTMTVIRHGSGVKMSPYGSVPYTKVFQYVNVTGIDPLFREVKVTRTISTSLDVPLPTFKGLGKIASWEHGLNGVALLATASSKNPDDVIREGLNRLRR